MCLVASYSCCERARVQCVCVFQTVRLLPIIVSQAERVKVLVRRQFQDCPNFSVVVSAAVPMTLVLRAALTLGLASACSNLLVTPGASADGSAIIAYNADDSMLFGGVSH